MMNILNVYIQTEVPQPKDGEDQIILKITGKLVDWMLELEFETYSGYVFLERDKKVLYLIVLRTIYGILIASLLWYKKFRHDLEAA